MTRKTPYPDSWLSRAYKAVTLDGDFYQRATNDSLLTAEAVLWLLAPPVVLGLILIVFPGMGKPTNISLPILVALVLLTPMAVVALHLGIAAGIARVIYKRQTTFAVLLRVYGYSYILRYACCLISFVPCGYFIVLVWLFVAEQRASANAFTLAQEQASWMTFLEVFVIWVGIPVALLVIIYLTGNTIEFFKWLASHF